MAIWVFAEIETKNYLGYENKTYIKNNKNKTNLNSALTFQSEIKYFFKENQIYLKLDALKDFKDKKRNFLNLTELFYSRAFENFDFNIGKKVIFLGSLEAYNIVDIFNRQNYQKDFLNTHKKGSFMINVNYFFENDSNLKLYIKNFEENIKFPNSSSPYYPFSDNNYCKKVEFSTNNEEPSFMGTYSATYDDEIIADTTFGLFYGYDENILFKKTKNKVNPYLFQSAKFFTYDTFLINDVLYKLEASLTKVIDDGIFKINNYYQIGFGGEYTFEQIYKNHNLGIILEYYKSNFVKINFNNDLFFGLRYSLNDKDSSEFLGGFAKDIESKDKIMYAKYSGRLTDSLNMSADIRYIKNSTFLDEHLRIGCEIKYYFN